MAARRYLFLAVTTFLAGATGERSDTGNYLNRDRKNSAGARDAKSMDKHYFSPSDELVGKDLNDYRVDESKKYKIFSELSSNDGIMNIEAHSKENKENLPTFEQNKYKTTGNPETENEPVDHLSYLEMKVSNDAALQSGLNEKQHDDVKKLTSNADPSTDEDSDVDSLFNADIQPMPLVSAVAELIPEEEIINEMKDEPKQANDTIADEMLNIKSESDIANKTKDPVDEPAAKMLQKNIYEFKKNLSECLKQVQRDEKAPVKVLSPRYESPTHANCLVACVLKRNNVIDGFNVNRDNLLRMVLKFYEKNSKAVKKLSKNLNKCIALARKYKNECDVAAALNACTNDVMGSMKRPVNISY